MWRLEQFTDRRRRCDASLDVMHPATPLPRASGSSRKAPLPLLVSVWVATRAKRHFAFFACFLSLRFIITSLCSECSKKQNKKIVFACAVLLLLFVCSSSYSKCFFSSFYIIMWFNKKVNNFYFLPTKWFNCIFCNNYFLSLPTFFYRHMIFRNLQLCFPFALSL